MLNPSLPVILNEVKNLYPLRVNSVKHPFALLRSEILRSAQNDKGFSDRLLLLTAHSTTMTRALWAILVNAGFAAAGWRSGSMDVSGAVCGAVLGFIVYVCLDWQGYAILATFVVLGSVMTRLGYRRKQALGGAQAQGGKRSAPHALAKLSAGAICALLAVSWADVSLLWTVAFVAAFATALADTTGTELGQLYGKRPVLLPSLRSVPVGTDGAVSLEGTVLALLFAALLASEAWALRLIQPAHIPFVVLASGVGIIGESLLARARLNGHLLNFLHTLFGAMTAAVLYHFFSHR